MTVFKIEDIGNVIGGGTPSTKKKEYYTEKGIPWITPKDLSGFDRTYISHGSRDITREGFSNSSVKLIPKESVLISSRAPIGYVAIAENDLTTNQGFKSIVPDKDKILPKFLYYLMLTQKEKLESVSSGSTFKEVSGKTMKNFSIDVPTIEKQKKIVSKIDPIVKKIELNKEINKDIEEIVLIRYKKIFGDFKEEKRVGDYIIPKKGKSLKKSDVIPGKFPVVGGGLKENAYHNEFNTTERAITISASGANAGFVNFWMENVWSSDSSYIDESVSKNVFFWYFFLKSKQRELFDLQTGSVQPHIYPKQIEGLPIYKLDPKKVKDFNEEAKKMYDVINNNNKENLTLSKLKIELINKLIVQ